MKVVTRASASVGETRTTMRTRAAPGVGNGLATHQRLQVQANGLGNGRRWLLALWSGEHCDRPLPVGRMRSHPPGHGTGPRA